MTEGIIPLPRELFEKMLEHVIRTDMCSEGSHIRAREITTELRRLGIWFKKE